jgi:cytoskeletal protein CcmA (bactofilin family)
MRKQRGLILALLFSAILVLCWQAPVLGQNIGLQSPQMPTQGVRINDDYLTVGNTIAVNQKIAGDLYAAGRNILVQGDLGGDILAVGQMIDIEGSVGGSIRAAGSQISLSGTVLRNANITGQNLTIAPEGKIAGNAYMAGQTIRIDGKVGGSLMAAAATVMISGEIDRDVQVSASRVVVLPGAKIGGNLTYTSQNQAEVSPDAQIKGTTAHIPVSPRPKQAKPAAGALILRSLLSLLTLLLAALVFVLLLPRCVHSVAATVSAQPWLCLGLGFAGLLVPPFLAIILFVTIIGSMLAWIVVTGYLVFLAAAFLLGKILIGFLIGGLILRAVQKRDSVSAIWSVLLGTALLWLASYIPFMGWLFTLFSVVFTLGALLYLASLNWFARDSVKAVSQPET